MKREFRTFVSDAATQRLVGRLARTRGFHLGQCVAQSHRHRRHPIGGVGLVNRIDRSEFGLQNFEPLENNRQHENTVNWNVVKKA
jgi:hypothetical protein